MNYQNALEKLHGLRSFGIRPGMERIRELLRRLDDPQLRIGRYFHVAGTNGKGSVSMMLQEISRASGLRTALFTSPHLHSHRERYRVDGQPIGEQTFCLLFEEVLAAIESMVAEGWESPTEFEAATALAFRFFAEEQVELAVMEVGLGGNLDSTNVLPGGIQIITNIGMDHMDYLGNSIPEIARCKAGIIKPGSPVVTGAEGEALPVIAGVAAEQGAKLFSLGREIRLMGSRLCEEGSFFGLEVAGRGYKELFLPLLGRHQLKNAPLAVAAAQLGGFSEEAIRQGLANTRWPGRLELISRDPQVLLDGAHNAPATQALAQALQDYWPGKRILCLMSMLADKQWEEALQPLLPLLSRAIVTSSPYSARQGDWRELAALCQAGGVAADCIENRQEACDAALAALRAGDYELLLVCGSLYLIGDVRLYLLDQVCPPA